MEGFYMFKKGFTLAEVLITLGIVGVIAAITLPTLTQSTTTAQIGPKLAKAASAFEQANKALLDAYDVDRLSETGLLKEDATELFVALSDYLAMSPISDEEYVKYQAKDGVVYTSLQFWPEKVNAGISAHKNEVGYIQIDINGEAGPGIGAEDQFAFSYMDDGSLQPEGGTFLHKYLEHSHWTEFCPVGQEPDRTLYCTGHIFENNLKVLYK